MQRLSTSRLDLALKPEGTTQEPSRPTTSGTLTRKASLNAFASLVVYFTQIAVGLVVNPILVAGLGTSLFGVWQMLGRLVDYMRTADGRPTEALRLVIAHQQAVPGDAAKRRSVGSAFGVWLISIPVLAAAGTLIVWLAPAVTKVPPESSSVVRLTCALLVINFMLANLVALPESVLRGMNLGYKRLGWQAGLNLVGGGLMAGAIYAGTGLLGVAGAQLTLAALTGVLFWLLVKKYVPWFGVALPSIAEIRSFLGISIWNFAGALIAQVHFGSDVLILGVITSASTVASYVLTGYAAQGAMGMISLLYSSVAPGLGGLVGQRQYDKTASVLNEMLATNWLLVTAIGSTIVLWNRSFLHLWVGSQHYAGFWSDLLIVLIMGQTIFIRTYTCVIDSTLQLRTRVIVNAFAAALSIVFAIVLTPFLGIVGLCLGILSGRLLQLISHPFIANWCLKRPQRIRLACLIRPGILMGLLLAGSGYLGQCLLVRNWTELIVLVGGSLVLISFLALVAGLSVESRKSLMTRLRLLRSLANG